MGGPLLIEFDKGELIFGGEPTRRWPEEYRTFKNIDPVAVNNLTGILQGDLIRLRKRLQHAFNLNKKEELVRDSLKEFFEAGRIFWRNLIVSLRKSCEGTLASTCS